MAAKDELVEVKKIDGLINTKLEIVQELRSLAEKVTSTMSTDPRCGGISDKTGDNVVKIIMLEQEINALIDELVNKKRKAINRIGKIKDADRRRVLSLRYLANKSWEQIAEKMDKTTQWVHVLHGRALQDYDKIE